MAVRQRRGLSIVEASFTTVIVGIMLVAALRTTGVVSRHQITHANRGLKSALAAELMGEVLQAYYADPDDTPVFGPEPDEETTSRIDFDDIDDYRNWSEQPPRSKDGTPLTGFASYRRTVHVEPVSLGDPSTSAGADSDLRRIVVEVSGGVGPAVSVESLRSRHGAYEQRPVNEGTFVRWVGLEMQVGESSGTVVAGTNVVNQGPEPP
jgi:hypothetical protein